MIKRLFIFLALVSLLSVGTLSAQFSLGIKASYETDLGFDEKWALSDGQMNFIADPSQGFNVGIMMRIGKRLYVQPEVLYNWQFYNYVYNLVDADPNIYKARMSSIDIPVLVGFRFFNSSTFDFRLMVGPKFRINLGDKIKVTDGANFISQVRGTQVGLDVGVGIDIVAFTLDFRYNLMQGVNKFNTTDNVELHSPISNCFEISIGWMFLRI